MALKNKVVIPQKHLYNTGTYNLQPPGIWNTKRNDHFKYLYIILHQPTNQTQIFLVRSPMVISDQIGQKVYHPQQKENQKIHTLAGWGFPSLIITWKRFFSSPTSPSHREKVSNFKKISLLDTETHLTDSKKRCLYFYNFSVVFLVAPQKEPTSNWCVFSWNTRGFTENNHPQASMKRPSRPIGSLHIGDTVVACFKKGLYLDLPVLGVKCFRK